LLQMGGLYAGLHQLQMLGTWHSHGYASRSSVGFYIQRLAIRQQGKPQLPKRANLL
jgi:hypothetical protein